MTNEECLDKALEYTGITNNCCCKVYRCIYSDRCYLQGEVSECEEYTVFKRIKNALEREPVRHGHWNRFSFNGYVDYVCSECGVSQNRHQVEWGSMKYCPSCGAKMDAQEKDDDRKTD